MASKCKWTGQPRSYQNEGAKVCYPCDPHLVVFQGRSDIPESDAPLLHGKAIFFLEVALQQRLSSSLSHLARLGGSVMAKYSDTDKTMVTTPSRMKIHRQALYPHIPSIFPMALASSPLNAPPSAVETKKR